MLGGTSEKDAKTQISKHFPWCPFCCFEQLRIDLEPERRLDYISCGNCGAKWALKIQEKLKSVKLVEASIDWKGRDLLQKEMDPKFWQDKAWLCILTRRTPDSL